MLCSGEELGLNDDLYPGSEVYGLLDLPKDTVPGTPIQEVVGLDDYIFDISITANRADCQSVLGIAREVSAVLNKPPENACHRLQDQRLYRSAPVHQRGEATDLCPATSATMCATSRRASPALDETPAGPLRPTQHLQRRGYHKLRHAGNRPADARFDMDTLESCQILVRRAKDGEKSQRWTKRVHPDSQ